MTRTAARCVVLAVLCLAHSPCLVAQSSPASGAASADRAFGRHQWHLELDAEVWSEVWNYNGSREEVYGLATGLTYGLRDGLVLVVSTPMLYVSQRGSDGLAIGVTGGVRRRIVRGRRSSVFLELSVGASQADTKVPPRGTRFNYLFEPGIGMTLPAAGGSRIVLAVRWLHLSNNSLAGPDRNPDVQAVGLRAGVLLPF